jgi:NAD(P)-dependent dehydrogenase (short-subunit alcohol dehydrogenase family)
VAEDRVQKMLVTYAGIVRAVGGVGAAQVEALFARVDDELGTLTALVNNAVRAARGLHLHCAKLPKGESE